MTASKPDIGHELDILGAESECSYLPGRQSLMHYRVALSLPADRYESLLARGWRRFGRTMFRPVCRHCSECRSLRVDIGRFQPSKSQRRLARKNADIELTIQAPTITDEHIALYNSYHADMQQRRGWAHNEIDEDQYHESFVDGNWPFAREFQYRRDGRLSADVSLRIGFAASRADYAACVQIRTQVFVVEQGVDPALEIDAAEDVAVHALASLGSTPVGALRWRRATPDVVKIERVAVLKPHRGDGVGAALMRWSLAHIRGARTIALGAQLTALPFYERLGFAAEGEIYDDAGIPHRRMVLNLV